MPPPRQAVDQRHVRPDEFLKHPDVSVGRAIELADRARGPLLAPLLQNLEVAAAGTRMGARTASPRRNLRVGRPSAIVRAQRLEHFAAERVQSGRTVERDDAGPVYLLESDAKRFRHADAPTFATEAFGKAADAVLPRKGRLVLTKPGAATTQSPKPQAFHDGNWIEARCATCLFGSVSRSRRASPPCAGAKWRCTFDFRPQSIPRQGPGGGRSTAAKPVPPADQQTVTWSDDAITAAKLECAKALLGMTLEYEQLPPLKEGLCGAPAPILVKSIGGVAIDPAATHDLRARHRAQ